MKNIYVQDLKLKKEVSSSFMVMKILTIQEEKTIAYIGDNTGDTKASIPDKQQTLAVGDVISVKGKMDNVLIVDTYVKVENYDLRDFLRTVNRPIEEIMNEIETMSQEEFKSKECIELNNYFFKNKVFIEKFQMGIGGLVQHHNYLGGLAEHTLNTMYLAKTMAYRYNSRLKEITILGAKLHDIGKIEEYDVSGPFSVTKRGDMEGHIVIGVNMLEDAFREGGDIYSEDFKLRMKSCIIQHHGKLEYGSPIVPKTEEAFMVHYADYIDAMMNKISSVRETTDEDTWSEYDRRIGTKIYF